MGVRLVVSARATRLRVEERQEIDLTSQKLNQVGATKSLAKCGKEPVRSRRRAESGSDLGLVTLLHFRC